MRSVHERPDNPWPHEMVISVDHPNHLLTLLFVRETWRLTQDIDVPAVLPQPAPGASALPPTASVDTWSDRWRSAWQDGWDWYSRGAAGDALPIDTEPRGIHTNPAMPPLWETEYGSEGIDREALWQWTLQLQDPPTDLESTPERRSLPALITAWRAGIDAVIVLPYAIDFAQRITTRHLVVSAVTRDTPDLYSRALRDAADATPASAP